MLRICDGEIPGKTGIYGVVASVARRDVVLFIVVVLPLGARPHLPLLSSFDLTAIMEDRDDDGFKSFIKGFAAGIIVANFNRQLVLGALTGAIGGLYYQQEYGAPDARAMVEDAKAAIRNIINKGK